MWEAIQTFCTVVAGPRLFVELACCAAATVIVMGFPRVSGKGKNILSFTLLAGLFTGVLFLLDMLYFAVSTTILQSLGGINFSLSILTGIVFYALLLCKYGKKERCVLMLTLFAGIVMLIELGGPNGIIWVTGARNSAAWSLLSFIVYILIIIFALYIRWISVGIYEVSWQEMALGCTSSGMVALSGILYERLFVSIGDTIPANIRTYISVVFFLLLLIHVVVYTCCYQITKGRKQLLEMQATAQKRNAEYELMKLSENNLEELRELRHDIRNQCLYMRKMLAEQKYGELDEYFESFTGKFSTQLFRSYDFGNRTVSAILNLERMKAEEQGIQINTSIVVPKTLPFEESDLCSLLMNVLDNAIEECARTEGEKTVNVVLNMRGNDYFYLCVMNPTIRSGKNISLRELPTSKADRSLHGYGLKIIRNIAAKYGGHFSCRIENGQFLAEVLMNVPAGAAAAEQK